MSQFRIDYQWREPDYGQYQRAWQTNWSVVTAETKAEALEKFKQDWTGNNEFKITSVQTCGLESKPPALSPEILAAFKEVLRISDRKHEAWAKAKVGVAQLEGQQPLEGIIPMLELHPDIWEDVIYKGDCPAATKAFEDHVSAWDPKVKSADEHLNAFEDNLTGEESWQGVTEGVQWVMNITDGVSYLRILLSPHLTVAKQQAYNKQLAVPKPNPSGTFLTYTVPPDWWSDELED